MIPSGRPPLHPLIILALFGLTAALAAGSVVAVLLLPASKKRQPHKLSDDLYGVSAPSWLEYGFHISAVALLGGAAYGTVMIFSPLYLRANGIWPLSLFFSTYAAAAIFARFVGRNWADRYGRIRLACACFMVLTIATLCLGRSAHTISFAAASALFGVGHGLMYPAVAAHSIQVIPGNLRAMTIWAGGFIIGISAGAACAGVVAEYSDIGTAIQLAALLPFTAFVLLCFQSRKLFLENR